MGKQVKEELDGELFPESKIQALEEAFDQAKEEIRAINIKYNRAIKVCECAKDFIYRSEAPLGNVLLWCDLNDAVEEYEKENQIHNNN